MSGLTRRWGGWVKGAGAPFAFRQASAPESAQVLLIDRPGQEAVLRCGTLSTPRGDRAQTALEVLQEYLTLSLPGWASQVASSQQVRAAASLETRKMTGFFQLSIQAPADQIPAYVRRYQQSIADIERGQVSREQFEEAKRVVVQEFKNGLMAPSSRLRYVLETHLYGLGVNYISNFGVRISRITPETFQAAIKEHFSDKKLLIVLSGPKEVLEKNLTEFGTVRLLN
jgi:predicted Zn-dependent peptidase